MHEKFHASGDLGVSDGAFFLKDVLKAPMGFRIKAGFSESSLTITRASLSAPDSDLELTGSLKNFLAPQFSFAIKGKSFNVDKALVLPAPGAAPQKNALRFVAAEAAYAAPAAADVNPMLEMAKNPMIAGAAIIFFAFYGFDTLKLNEQWQVSGGLRLEHYNTQTDVTTVSGSNLIASNLEKSGNLLGGKLGLNLSERWIGAGVFNNEYIESQTNCPLPTAAHPTIYDNHMPGAVYIDFGGSYQYSKREVLLAIRAYAQSEPIVSKGNAE